MRYYLTPISIVNYQNDEREQGLVRMLGKGNPAYKNVNYYGLHEKQYRVSFIKK
jgi:hypothetical protein